ncbi:restriction endonuclease [Psychromonas sp. SP041]|uniref:restriction endonuclease n=1 Tax=Psychromonas sp. SP041 TaxID=1365007 RepID=UPI0014852359|nr:restriction endonuclease [Psychromonas sp. SP041]
MRKVKNKNNNLNHLSWREFEVLTKEIFQSQGYKAEVIGGSGGDGGIDVLLKKGGKKYIVQCKHWKNSRVGVKVVRELFGVMLHEKADGVKIIATSGFTKESYNFIKGKKIELIDGKKLMTML